MPHTLMERMEAAERRIAELERQLRELGVQQRIPARFLKTKADAPYDALSHAPPLMPMPKGGSHE